MTARASFARARPSLRLAAALLSLGFAAGCGSEDERGPASLTPEQRAALTDLSPDALPGPPADPTNRYLEDAAAAAFGHKFFFDPRFSGPLLDESNTGIPGTLGVQGETGKVACASCHVPGSGFLDSRSPRRQISLGAGWTRRRAPSLLNVAQGRLLMWDGRHDTAFSQPFTPLEDALEINSSRLFVAQQIARLYRDEYEAIFGPLPNLDAFPVLDASEAGCTEIPDEIPHATCVNTGHDDPDVTRVVVNVGKAIQAYTRQISCGKTRFDRWMDGDATALTADEQAGALLFVGKGACNSCHSGPFLSDQDFHNVGLHGDFQFFIGNFEDPGASQGLAAMLADPLNSKGEYSDGYDGRQDRIRADDPRYLGAFKTPTLRCVSKRPSFMHTGQFRSLEDVVIFFNRGGDKDGYVGESENRPRDLTTTEREQLTAFLRALDGEEPDPSLLAPPELPPDP